jgi:hypothetical protein
MLGWLVLVSCAQSNGANVREHDGAPEAGPQDAPYIDGGPIDPSEGGACAGELQQATLSPFDLLALVDRSGSMALGGGGAISKWAALKAAFGQLVKLPLAQDLGLGLQYYALPVAGIGGECTKNADCGQYGPCIRNKICSDGSDANEQCETDADCTPGASCLPLAVCGYDPIHDLSCSDVGQFCDNGALCSLPVRYCTKRWSCDPETYANPKVAMLPIAGNASALLESLYTTLPEGENPLGPALSGALGHVRGWADAHPERGAGVLVFTDGDPGAYSCLPDADAQIQLAKDAFEATPPVRTFVIGIIGTGGSKQAKLDFIHALATAGGTTAFVADETKDLAQQFLEALTQIRRDTILQCEFPLPEASAQLDYFQVNLEFSESGDGPAETIPYVKDAAACTQETGGWYYDQDPAQGGVPTKIVTCLSTCDALKAAVLGRIELRVGCATVVPR